MYRRSRYRRPRSLVGRRRRRYSLGRRRVSSRRGPGRIGYRM